MKWTNCYSLLLFLLCISLSLSGQPANDNACDAIELFIDSAAVVVSNVGATVEMGEQSIVPPNTPLCSSCQTPVEAWYDTSGPNGDPAINHSIWFKFTATSEDVVEFRICDSVFLPQIALYQVSNCADFGSYTLIRAIDQTRICPSSEPNFLFRIQCLDVGAEYFLLIDDWQAEMNNPVDSGQVEVAINSSTNADPGINIKNSVIVINPVCPGGSDGLIDICLISGTLPISFEWSHGANTEDAVDVPAGIYQVTMTDFCGSSQVATFDVEEASEPRDIVFASLSNEILHPTHCGDGAYGGQISAPISEGVAPFSYLWSTGDTSAFLSGLDDGEYTVSLTDYCGIKSTERTYHLGMDAGPDIDFDINCLPTEIGLDHSLTGGEVNRITYNDDQSIIAGHACRVDSFSTFSATWRSFDLVNDFGLSGEVNLDGVELFLNSQPFERNGAGIKVKFTAYTANTPLLDDPDLDLTSLDDLTTYIPKTYGFTSYIVPLKAPNLDANSILVIKAEILFAHYEDSRLDFGVNSSPTTQTTYISSEACDISSPVTLSSLGYDEELVMNVFFSEETGLSYQWEGPVDDLTSPSPTALGTELENTYKVTITDDACGLTRTDEVVVTCAWASNTKELKETSFSVHPNPNNGHFQLLAEGALQQINCKIYNAQGQQVSSKQTRLGYGNTTDFDLNGFSKGIYWLSIASPQGAMVKRLMIQ